MRSLIQFNISRRFLRVWQRNFMVYLKTWKINFIPPLLEPLFYLLAFGIGLSSLIGNVRYGGATVGYVNYIAPALIAIGIMYNSFFETTYSSFVRMYYQKTFHAIVATPLSIEEIITGEIVWGATRSVIATCIMTAVIGAFGLIRFPEGLLLIPVALIGGFAFGSLGMIFTGIVPTIDVFNLPIFLFITPMFLFSGTFFPIDTLPAWAQQLAVVLPLTPLVHLTRSLTLGLLDATLLRDLAYLVIFGIVLFPLALILMHRRLIK